MTGNSADPDVAKIEQIPFHEKSRIHGREGANFSRYAWHKEPQAGQIDRQIVLVGLYVQLRNQRAAGLFVSPGSLVQLSHRRSDISAVLKRDVQGLLESDLRRKVRRLCGSSEGRSECK